MMKTYVLICCFFCCLHFYAQAQEPDFDEIVRNNKATDCADVRYNVTDIVLDLYEKNDIESIYKFLDYWKSKCPYDYEEEIFRLSTIFDIKTGLFNADSIDEGFLKEFIKYNNLFKPPTYYRYMRYIPRISEDTKKFIQLTQKIAQGVEKPLSLDERLIIEFYSADSASFQGISNAPENESRLKYFYNKLVKEAKSTGYTRVGIFVGVAPMQGALSFLGTRPNIGFLLGGKKKRNTYDIVLDIKTGPSPGSYTIQYQDSLLSINSWTGAYLGFEYAYDIISGKRFDLAISPGIGWDYMAALERDNRFGEEPKSFSSVNLNGGLGLTYKFKKQGFLGIQGRYNWVNYQSKLGETALNGSYFSLRFLIGFMNNDYKNSAFESLGGVPLY